MGHFHAHRAAWRGKRADPCFRRAVGQHEDELHEDFSRLHVETLPWHAGRAARLARRPRPRNHGHGFPRPSRYGRCHLKPGGRDAHLRARTGGHHRGRRFPQLSRTGSGEVERRTLHQPARHGGTPESNGVARKDGPHFVPPNESHRPLRECERRGLPDSGHLPRPKQLFAHSLGALCHLAGGLCQGRQHR